MQRHAEPALRQAPAVHRERRPGPFGLAAIVTDSLARVSPFRRQRGSGRTAFLPLTGAPGLGYSSAARALSRKPSGRPGTSSDDLEAVRPDRSGHLRPGGGMGGAGLPAVRGPAWLTVVEAPDSAPDGTGLWFAVVQCLDCGLCFTNPRPSEASIGQFYPSTYQPHRSAGSHRGRKPWFTRLPWRKPRNGARRWPGTDRADCSISAAAAGPSSSGWWSTAGT